MVLRDVELIERIDSDNRTGDGCRNLPAEEFRAQVVNVGYRNSYDGVSGLFDRSQLGFLICVSACVQPNLNENPIVTVNLRRPQQFTVHRDDPLTNFACRLG